MHVPRSPETIAADRARYEAHQARGLDAPRALPSPSPRPAPEPKGVLWREDIPGGWYWTTRLAAGESLRLVSDGGSVALACWSAQDPSERMNLPDTVKSQWTTELSRGRLILSDMGRVMLAVTEDSCGAHDVLTGGSTTGLRGTRSNMVLAAAKLGLDRRDLPALLTLFAPVRVDAAGRFEWRGAMLAPGDWVELRAEMDLLVALSACPHPLDPDQAPRGVAATRLAVRPVPADDPCRTATPEAVRAFENTARPR